MKEKDFALILRNDLIREAFRRSVFERIISCGYCDMNPFFYERLITKAEIYSRLETNGSPLLPLFGKKYAENLEDFSEALEGLHVSAAEMSVRDAEAIVFYLYRAIATNDERIACTNAVLQEWNGYINTINDNRDALSKSQGVDLKLEHGVLYDSANLQMFYIDSIARYFELMNAVDSSRSTKKLFYRGHEKLSYVMQPALFRSNALLRNEQNMYQELMFGCPDDFDDLDRHLDILSVMQQAGLPARLMSVTGNPLAALYFASGGEENDLGEFIVYSSYMKDIQYPQSDRASILSSLPLFDNEEQKKIYDLSYLNPDPQMFCRNDLVRRLSREVQGERPGFSGEIDPAEIRSGIFVVPARRDRRIEKQDTAYILCGLLDEAYGNGHAGSYIAKMRMTVRGKRLLCIVDRKQRIRRQLDALGVNHAVMFPKIEEMADYISRRYGSGQEKDAQMV